MRRWWFVLLVVATPLHAASDPAAVATDLAQEAMAGGETRRAAQALEAGIAGTDDPVAANRLRCDLAGVLAAIGDDAGVIRVASQVPIDAACGPRAAFERAAALERLGRLDEAAALHQTLAATTLGADRDGLTADAVVALADRVLAKQDSSDQIAFALMEQALALRISDERAGTIARRHAAALAVDHQPPWRGPGSHAACDGLLRVLGVREDASDRLSAARTCDPVTGRLLLEGLPTDDPEAQWARAELLYADPASFYAASAAALIPLQESVRTTRRRALAEQAGPWSRLDAIVWLEQDGTAGSLAERVNLLRVASWDRRAADAGLDWLTRFPADPERASVESWWADAMMDLARRAANDGRFDEAVANYEQIAQLLPAHEQVPTALREAGLADYRAGRLDQAVTRWNELVAARPEHPEADVALASVARLVALDRADPQQATDLLERSSSYAATAEIERLRAPFVAIESLGRVVRDPTVRLTVRNVEEVELRLHRIDLEAHVRAGGAPEDLKALDVGVIAPDRQWTVQVPDATPLRDRVFDTAVAVPGPGLYAVTVASPDQEAKALVLVSDLTVVARGAGADLAVATFDAAGAPAPDARLVLQGPDTIEARTDPTGLWTGVVEGGSQRVVLAERRGSWAITTIERLPSSIEPSETVVSTELDRALYLPGDRVGLRTIGRDAGQPIVGTWTLWIGGQTELSTTTAAADEHGIVTAELLLPDTGGQWVNGLPVLSHATVMGLPPGVATPRVLATLRIAPRDPGGHRLTARLSDSDAVFSVQDAGGVPRAGLPLRVGDAVYETDGAGRVAIPGPRAALPWNVSATLASTSVTASIGREPEASGTILLRQGDDHLRPGERPDVEVKLLDAGAHSVAGTLRVELVRLLSPVASPQPPPDPWVRTPETELRGWSSWNGAEPERTIVAEQTVGALTAAVDDWTPLTMPAQLDPGDWEVRVTDPSGGAFSASTRVRVSATSLRLLGAHDVGLGDTLSLRPEGGAALVTVESEERIVFAAVRTSGRSVDVPVDASWSSATTAAVAGPTGDSDARTFLVDPDFRVSLEATQVGAGFDLVAKVTDHRGRPVAAQVAFSAADQVFEDHAGVAPQLDRTPWRAPGAEAAPSGAVGNDLVDGAIGEAIAPALLAEEARRVQREKAMQAGVSGLLSDNALAEAMIGDVDLVMGGGHGGGGSAMGMGSFGSTGSGSGASGYGSGSGTYGVRLPGVRERVLWQLSDTDEGGIARARLEGPPALWNVRAVAVNDRGLGRASREVDGRERLWMRAETPAPGWPGDTAVPVVTVTNGTSTRAVAELRIGDRPFAVDLEPGHSTQISFGDTITAGRPALALDLRVGGATVQQASWDFGLLAGAADEAGGLTVVAVGRGGRIPTTEIALRDDPALASLPWRAAVRGRAALASLAFRDEALARVAVRSARDLLRARGERPDAAAAAQELLFLAEARDAGFPISRSEIVAIADRLPAPGTVADRVWIARARAAAELPVDANLLSVIAAEALAPAEQRVFDATLRRLGREAPKSTSPADAPPDPGDPALPDWIAAVGRKETGKPATGTVSIRNGDTTTLVDLSEGGVRWFDGPVEISGPARSWRAGVPLAGDLPAVAQRAPAGFDGRPLPEIGETKAPRSCSPCQIRVGDFVRIDEAPPGFRAPGLHQQSGPDERIWLRAVTPGRFTIRGLLHDGLPAQDVVVEVIADGDGAVFWPPFALALAARDGSAQRPPTFPSEVEGSSVQRLMNRIAFDWAMHLGEDGPIAATFRTLAASDPSAELSFSQVARVADALRSTGDPAAAIRVWRAGADAAFRAEVAGIQRFEDAAGPLVAIRHVREAADRYPTGRAVGEALYLLPARLLQVADGGVPEELVAAGITDTDLRLTAAAWDREFLARSPEHPNAAAAGLRLARTLLTLGATEPAARWAERVASTHSEDPLLDSLIYLRALALTEGGEGARAEPLLQRLVDTPFTDASGTPRPSAHFAEATLVLGRLYESRGRIDRALEAYDEAGNDHHASALRASFLELPASVALRDGQSARIDIRAQNVDQVQIRAYRIDLRTLFLRDGGLDALSSITVAGVSPSWSGDRKIGAGPFPERRTLDLPLAGRGAWWVQVGGDGHQASLLVVRSDLELHVFDQSGSRRVTVRRDGAPAAGIEVRALQGGMVSAAVSDVRGVAEVPAGAAVLAWSDDSYAFTSDHTGASGTPIPAPPTGTGADLSDLMRVLDERASGRQADDVESWQRTWAAPAKEGLSLETL